MVGCVFGIYFGPKIFSADRFCSRSVEGGDFANRHSSQCKQHKVGMMFDLQSIDDLMHNGSDGENITES
jgi:hypothetical protein